VLVVDTVGFEPGILSADGRLPHSQGLHVIEQFTLEQEGRALRRRWVAEDPQYFEGQYTGSDVVFVSDVAYQPTPCEDLSYKSTLPANEGTRSWGLWTGVAAAALLVMAGFAARRRFGRRV
jgi:hypothetical protein